MLPTKPLREYWKVVGKMMWWWAGSITLFIAGVCTDMFGWDIHAAGRVALWLLAASGLVFVPMIAFVRVYRQRDALRDRRCERIDKALDIVVGIKSDLVQLVDRITSDQRGVWLAAGQHLLYCMEYEVMPPSDFIDLHNRIDLAKSGQLKWQSGRLPMHSDYFVVMISVLGQREERGIVSAFLEEDLRWGMNCLVEHLDNRIGMLQKEKRALHD